MKLSHSSALAIVSSLLLSANALVVPQDSDDLIAVFGHATKDVGSELSSDDAVPAVAIVDTVSESDSDSDSDSDSPLDLVRHALERLRGAVSGKLAPLLGLENRDVIPHRYIVVMRPGVSESEADLHREWVEEQHSIAVASANADHDFFALGHDHSRGILDSFGVSGGLHGYFGYFLPDAMAAIRANPLVQYVEADSVVHANTVDVQKGAPWGLARVSHRDTLGLSLFNQYLYDTNGGKGVTAYVIDTGINVGHEDFGGRAKWGSTVPSGDEDVDGNGHGTHCAGTIAGKTYGVAKGANVVAIKVLRLNGSGSMSDVVKGVDVAVTMHRAEVKKNAKGFKGSTANMSLGGGKSPTLDMAVNAAVDAGIHFAVAAGNENQDACNLSPARAANAVTVGASTIGDARAYFSNFGSCVDIFGPGLNILSTYIGSSSATATLLGTSMALPHIAGLLSYYVSLQPNADSEFFSSGNGITPKQLKKQLVAFGTKNVLTDIPNSDTPNVLAYNGGSNSSALFSATEENAGLLNTKEAKHGKFGKFGKIHGKHHDEPHGKHHRKPNGKHHDEPHGKHHDEPHGKHHDEPHGKHHDEPHGKHHDEPHGKPHGKHFKGKKHGCHMSPPPPPPSSEDLSLDPSFDPSFEPALDRAFALVATAFNDVIAALF